MTRASGQTFRGCPLVSGSASGPALVLEEPLSFWGGVDSSTGRIVDPRHPQSGMSVRGCVLLMPSGRGSSSSSSVVAEAVRAGTAPAALLLLKTDEILALGAVVAQELYGRTMPVLLLGEEAYRSISTGDLVEVCPSGDVRVK